MIATMTFSKWFLWLVLPPILLLLASCAAGDRVSSQPAEVSPLHDPHPDQFSLSEVLSEVPLDGPTVIALGSVQDGGLPHAGCSCERCELARRDPRQRRLVTALGVVIPAPDGGAPAVYLIDATPDVEEQLHLLRPFRWQADEPSVGRVDRTPLDGILLTHAHMGHYLGLAHFGFEVMHASGVTGYCTPRMAAFLRHNGPWSQLVDKGELKLHETLPGQPVDLGGAVSFTPIAVPHRDEFSDTVAYLLSGPRRTLLYVPDTDSWRAWPRPLLELLAEEQVDVLVADGTFFSLDELPGRDVSSIGHPLITETMDLLAEEVSSHRVEVFFTHLNHSNPALLTESAARREIAERGFGLLNRGQKISL